MGTKRRLGTAVLATGLALAGMTATAPTAAAATCPADRLCLSEYYDLNTIHATIASTKACVSIAGLGPYDFEFGIASYRNNLPVKAAVYSKMSYGYKYDGTIQPGGASSNTYGNFGLSGLICTGGATP
ncbi:MULTISPECIES: hypothetical protein [unclassified Streptomyces]|uniref:hypothetical protein n=1 Tax=unclassified Streptomyces TaxID=2593676 RepID=UPI0004C88081|nr:hypothetical protein [Streptomyces sp. NRRL F-5727]